MNVLLTRLLHDTTALIPISTQSAPYRYRIQSHLAIHPKNLFGATSDPGQQVRFCYESFLNSQHFIRDSEASVLSSSGTARFDYRYIILSIKKRKKKKEKKRKNTLNSLSALLFDLLGLLLKPWDGFGCFAFWHRHPVYPSTQHHNHLLKSRKTFQVRLHSLLSTKVNPRPFPIPSIPLVLLFRLPPHLLLSPLSSFSSSLLSEITSARASAALTLAPSKTIIYPASLFLFYLDRLLPLP